MSKLISAVLLTLAVVVAHAAPPVSPAVAAQIKAYKKDSLNFCMKLNDSGMLAMANQLPSSPSEGAVLKKTLTTAIQQYLTVTCFPFSNSGTSAY